MVSDSRAVLLLWWLWSSSFIGDDVCCYDIYNRFSGKKVLKGAPEAVGRGSEAAERASKAAGRVQL